MEFSYSYSVRFDESWVTRRDTVGTSWPDSHVYSRKRGSNKVHHTKFLASRILIGPNRLLLFLPFFSSGSVFFLLSSRGELFAASSPQKSLLTIKGLQIMKRPAVHFLLNLLDAPVSSEKEESTDAFSWWFHQYISPFFNDGNNIECYNIKTNFIRFTHHFLALCGLLLYTVLRSSYVYGCFFLPL